MTAVTLGYCTNVHGGPSLAQTLDGLDRHAVAVRRLRGGAAPLPIGLWLSAQAAKEVLAADEGAARLRDWLGERGLQVFALNGFPFGDFRAARVKKAVYQPDWRDPRRAQYTIALADILAVLCSGGGIAAVGGTPMREASISTLPIAWREGFTQDGCGQNAALAAGHIVQVAQHLRAIEDRTGLCIHLDIEPEPGCVLDRSRDVIDFFMQAIRPSADLPDPSRHVRICHDICHAAVMFESQSDALANYRSAGIRVGRVQVSSALVCDGSERAFRALRNFDEPRFLHQTCVLDGAAKVHFFEDLGRAFDDAPDGVWRVHFHVPIDLEFVGPLSTTRRDIEACFEAIEPADGICLFEVETYAWDALPIDLRRDSLAHGIADELSWTRERLSTLLRT
jgi:sugar phosphate isomerase/epimerase